MTPSAGSSRRAAGTPVPLTGIEVVNVSKTYGAVRALRDVTVTIEPGTVHAFVGENGAGKSTLGKILSGAVQPDSGHVVVNGVATPLRSPREALSHGIAAIAQEISLVPQLTVEQNALLGVEPGSLGFLRRKQSRTRWRRLTEASGFDLPRLARAEALSLSQQQQVEIIRALSRNADLIVMDEPTAALNDREVRALRATITRLAAQGTAVIIVSHYLGEVLELADTITVLKDGHLVQTGPASAETEASLIRAMLGRELSAVFPEKHLPREDAPIVVDARGLRGETVRDLSLTVCAGEIVGVAGLDGSGREDVGRLLFGEQPLRAGSISIAGDRYTRPSPRRSWHRRMGLIPPSRALEGLFLRRPLTDNVSVSAMGTVSRAGFVLRRRERNRVQDLLASMGIARQRHSDAVSTLSGGNQQKVLFARALFAGTTVLIANEPTRGVDLGARAAIYQLLCALAAEGTAILLVSSEPDELIGLSQRVLVLSHGRVSAALSGDDITEENILTAALATPDADRSSS